MKDVYTVSLSPEDLRVIAAGLHELPYKLSADLLNRLQAAVDRQDKEAAEEAKKKEEEVAKFEEQRAARKEKKS